MARPPLKVFNNYESTRGMNEGDSVRFEEEDGPMNYAYEARVEAVRYDPRHLNTMRTTIAQVFALGGGEITGPSVDTPRQGELQVINVANVSLWQARDR